MNATITIAEDPYFLNQASNFPKMRPGNCYAPCGVFFRGGPVLDPNVALYHWDFGDGATLTHAYAFNAAYRYLVPGSYTVSLRVTMRDGTQSTASVSVVVHARTRQFYVNAQSGNDANDGTAPEKAWKSVEKALGGFNAGFYKPGDALLFQRGQTFPVGATTVAPQGNQPRGVLIGAHGSGARPILKHTGGPPILFNFPGGDDSGIAALSFMGLRFEGAYGEVWRGTQEVTCMLFDDCSFDGCERMLTFAQGSLGNRAHNVMLHGCEFKKSQATQFFILGADIAMIGNTFADSGNHLVYNEYADHAFYMGNDFARPAWGRTCLRVSYPGEMPSRNVCILQNRFLGWIDPRTSAEGTQYANGQRYNYTPVHLGPNDSKPGGIDDIAFVDNLVTDSECCVALGGVQHGVFRFNTFKTPNNYKNTDAGVFEVGARNNFPQRGCEDIEITDNTFDLGAEKKVPAIAIIADAQPHARINIARNSLTPAGTPTVNFGPGTQTGWVTTPAAAWFTGAVPAPTPEPVPTPTPTPTPTPEPPVDMATQAELDAVAEEVASLSDVVTSIHETDTVQNDMLAALTARVQALESQRDAVRGALQ